MLQKLNIQNYAIIDRLEIGFFDKLNIITGETGAGKSILVGALGLVFGERAESNILLQKERKCVVEASFSTNDNIRVRDFLKDNDLDTLEELVIRREVSPNGKSRAFVNDTPVNLNQLKILSAFLVDLHQQFDTRELNSSGFQQEVLDAFAGNGQVLPRYAEIFHQYRDIRKETDELKERQARANTELDYHKFLFEELDTLALGDNELEELEAELKLLSNAESVKQQLGAIYGELQENEQPLVQQLKALANKLRTLEHYHTGLPILCSRLLGAQAELADIAAELNRINDGIKYSAERIAIVNDRLSAGYRLLKKHNVKSTGELQAVMFELEKKLKDILNLTETIQQKEKLADGLFQQCTTLAAELSANRKKAIKPFTEKVNALLVQVGMPNARFAVDLQQAPALQDTGSDRVDFLFNANIPSGKTEKNSVFEPVRKVASGGELSRLMLCIKSLVAHELQLPTLIFDEIDSGISGEAARQVGNIMKSLSAAHQLISITHQPQIAARADAHFFVYKSISGDRIITSVRLLSNEERITTIAQMLSGEKPTAAALQNAREMLGN